MDFPHGQDVVRERRKRIVDPYNPDVVKFGSWDDPERLVLPGVFVASSSSNAVSSATRTQILTSKSLYDPNANADVLPGDRIKYGSSIGYVKVVPEADTSPFTGWRPVKEVPLEEADG